MYRQRRYDECIKKVKSKLKQSPNSLHLLNYQAMAYSALKRDKEALLSYQMIIKIDPTLAGPYYNCLLYTSPSPRDPKTSRMPSSA